MNSVSILATLLETPATRYGGTEGPDFTQYGILVVSLLATIGFLAFAFKRLVGGQLRRRAEQRALQVCDVLPLSNKQRLCVVRCYDRSFFLGVSDKQVDLIAELDAAAIGAQEQSTPIDPVHKDAFLRALKRVHAEHIAKKAQKQVVVQPQPAPASQQRKRVARPRTQAEAKQARTAQRTSQSAPQTKRRVAKAPAAKKRVAARRPRLDDGRGMLA